MQGMVRGMDRKWAGYVARVTRGENQVTVAARTGINQSTVGRWLRGSRPGDCTQVAGFARTYGGNVLEAFVAAGYITADEAGVPPSPTLEAVVDADPDLTDADKEHLKTHYHFLRMTTHRHTLLRQEIEQNTKLDTRTRKQLLARLDGDSMPTRPKSPAPRPPQIEPLGA